MTDHGIPDVDIDFGAIPADVETSTPAADLGRLHVRALADVRSRAVRFLVPGLIPLRTMTLVAGVGGLGKSTWLAGVTAGVTRGEYGEPGDVVVITYEDTAEEVWRPRVLAAEGDLRRVHEIYVDRRY